MSLSLDDTVAALASAPGAACRGIIRLSGPDVQTLLNKVIFPRISPNHLPNRHRGEFRLGNDGGLLPVDVLLWPNHRSYTGQPLAELHAVGSPPLLESALVELFRQGARPARAGEFTLRAFLAGRLDLMQAEAVLGVIDAEDHLELETALKQLGGGLSGQIAQVHADLLDLLADLEAGLDFVDEDIEFIEREDLLARLTNAEETIQRLANQAETRMHSTGRMRVVLAGLPNAGKSCLFNALVNEEAAIVSPIKGTTRDVLSGVAEVNGLVLEVLDTAGWESSPRDVMQQADQHRAESSSQADLLLYCIARDLPSEEIQSNQQLLTEFQSRGIPTLLVETKADLPANFSQPVLQEPILPVSALDQSGLTELQSRIAERLSESSQGARQLIGTTAARCQESLATASESLNHAIKAALDLAGDELIALEVHQTLDHLGRILGTIFTDDILDRIFSKFCIGK